ncbi:alpha/beta fold hydrolase [Croceibacterium ferulae]|uniref:alpha/beta fold hydrolase n=1 Tax=Croceibacterium ferulae TaxID=1854641 RepID=UPI000EB454EE|nr:alpha/beta hydrolase [Croceibacterium ferulae]
MTQKTSLRSHLPHGINFPTRGGRRGSGPSWIAGAAGLGALAASALFNRASKRRAEAATPPAGSFIEVDGVRLHYVDRGSGTPVVLLHGNGVTFQDYEASGVLDLAAEQHRVIAFDRPGFGYSERPRTTVWTPAAQASLIAKALNELGVGPAVVVGHSWGTLVALAMALDEPAAVSGLVLLSGYYYGTARPDVWPFSVPAIPLLGDLLANTLSPLAGRLIGPAAIKASFSPAPIPEKFAAFPLALTLRPSQVRATAADTAMMVPAAIELSGRYDRLAVPVIVMAGTGDLITHVNKHAERLADEIADAELRTIAEQGHLFHYAFPERVVSAIGDVARRAAA